MSVLLVGDATEYDGSNGDGAAIFDGFTQTYEFTAAQSGTVTEMRAWVEHGGTATDLFLCIYDDDGDYPGALLDVQPAGLPGAGSGDTWVTATGFNVAVVEGTKYHLGWLAIGGFISYDYDNTITRVVWNADPAAESAPDPFPPGLNPDDFSGSYAVGIQALGDAAVSLRFGSGLVWQVTGPWYPEAETVDYYGQVADPQDDSVTIPLDDSRLGEITVSVWDPIVTSLVGRAYGRLLKAYYHGSIVLWGVYKLGNIDAAAGTATLNVVDPSIRVIRHYLRRGDIDGDLSAPNDDKATVTIDGDGLRLLLDAARSIPAQTALGEPDIGIDPGVDTSTPAPDALMGVSRGDEVWATMIALSQALGPDFELAPTEDIVGAYCELRTYDRQGADKSATVKLHYATGLDNLDNLAFSEGSEYTTHDHVLSRDGRRVTSIAPAYLETGQYTTWSATDFDAANIDPVKADAVLAAYGEAFLKAYGRPLLVLTATMPVETEDGYLYLRDYVVGDTIEVAGKVGLIVLEEAPYRITQVTLRRVEGGIQPELQIVADRVAAAGDSIGGDIV